MNDKINSEELVVLLLFLLLQNFIYLLYMILDFTE